MALASFILSLAAAAAPSAAAPVEYNRDIRPILTENCFPCHGADSAGRKDDLRIDRFADAIAPRDGSRPAIVPGNADKSELVARIEDAADPMPPEKSHKKLSASQKLLLRRWVAQGAVYQEHWSFLKPQRPPIPQPAAQTWARNPIDNFVLAKLEGVKLSPAKEADRRTLARRVSLDLTGLPPSSADVTDFVNDNAPDAYEKLVDRLLASPKWGEHRGRYWLDAARYADSHGIHFDNFREIWVYRDWVIKALNRNLPFDQFSREQLAGDLLPGATLEQKIASGFNRCNITTNEGGAIDEEYLVLYARDRTETAAQVWLGLTAGCAVCHDHKYDPFSQKDFYSLSAFFNNTTQKAMDGNVSDTAPSLVVPSPDDRTRWDMVSRKVDDANARLSKQRDLASKEYATWLKAPFSKQFQREVPTDDLLVHLPLSDNQPRTLFTRAPGAKPLLPFTSDIKWQPGVIAEFGFTVKAATPVRLDDGGDFERGQAFSYTAWVNPNDSRDGAMLSRMDHKNANRGWDLSLEKGRPGAQIVHKWPSDALKVVAKNSIPKGRWAHLAVTYDGTSQVAGLKLYVDGEAQDIEVEADSLRNTIHTTAPLKLGQRHEGSFAEDTGLQDLRIYGRALGAEEIRGLANAPRLSWLLAQKPPLDQLPVSEEKAKQVAQEKKDELFSRWLVLFDRKYQQINEELSLYNVAQAAIRVRGTVAHVMSERTIPAEAHVLFRGEYDKRRDRVTPATPAALPAMPKNLPRNRLGFATWLFSPDHPLTARVTVNRLWQEVFGTGIVKTTGDLGISGEQPSNPALLDWLAVEFRESGWDLKKFFRLMVTSSTYRQAALATPEKIAADPLNIFLSRGPRFRMDAEMVRDYALSASGLMVDKIGGPSVKPYQPNDVWEAVAMPGSNTGIYKRDTGENLYRRSMYTFWKRSAPPGSMDIFNAPNRETCTVRRERTNTPLQALATLNDEQMVEAARRLAENALKSALTPAQRFDFMAMRVLARPLLPKEQKVLTTSYDALLQHYRRNKTAAAALVAVGESKADPGADPPTLAAFTMVANEILNLDEALNK